MVKVSLVTPYLKYIFIRTWTWLMKSYFITKPLIKRDRSKCTIRLIGTIGYQMYIVLCKMWTIKNHLYSPAKPLAKNMCNKNFVSFKFLKLIVLNESTWMTLQERFHMVYSLMGLLDRIAHKDFSLHFWGPHSTASLWPWWLLAHRHGSILYRIYPSAHTSFSLW